MNSVHLVLCRLISLFSFEGLLTLVGDNDDEDPPVPIPNTAVKLIGAEDTWREASWENKSLPTQINPNCCPDGDSRHFPQ